MIVGKCVGVVVIRAQSGLPTIISDGTDKLKFMRLGEINPVSESGNKQSGKECKVIAFGGL